MTDAMPRRTLRQICERYQWPLTVRYPWIIYADSIDTTIAQKKQNGEEIGDFLKNAKAHNGLLKRTPYITTTSVRTPTPGTI